MPPPLVLVTAAEYRRGEPVFSSATSVTCLPAPASEEELCDRILQSGARHVVVGSVAYRDRLYSTLPKGGVVARYGVGHDGIDKVKATRSGILCTNTPDVLHQSVAELTMLFAGAAARHLVTIAGAIGVGGWMPMGGVELRGRTLTIIGCGTIGRAVAAIAHGGFGMRVVGCSRRDIPPGGSAGNEHFDVMTAEFADAVGGADFVSLHIPAHPENARFINRERLSLFNQHAWLINTSRGAVVDEIALYDALVEERLGGAALDVFDHEPYEPIAQDHDLRTLSNVILTPHVGSNTAEANRRMAERALRNIELAEAGERSGMDLLNPEVFSSGAPQV